MRQGWLSRVVGSVIGLPRGGATEAGRARVLRAERAARAAEKGPPPAPQPSPSGDIGARPADDHSAGQAVGTLTNAEVSVLISVNNTLAGEDIKRSKNLLTGEQRLIQAAHAVVVAQQRLQDLRAAPEWLNHTGQPAPDESAHPASVDGANSLQDKEFREDFDPHRHMFSGWWLLAIELIFITVELFFWYGVFAEGVDPRFGWLHPQRIAAVLFAVLIPVTGVVMARILGKLGHRWVMRYPGTGHRERWGTACSALVSIAVVTAVYLLVEARFDARTRPVGATQLPANPMAVIFVVVIVSDMIGRVFTVSEIRTQTIRRAHQLSRLKRAVVKANRIHANSWVSLRAATQLQLDRYERIYGAGAMLITDLRAVFPERPSQPAVRPRDKAHEENGYAPATMAVPAAEPMHLFGQPLALGPLRRVGDAIDTLRSWTPMGQPQLKNQLDRLTDHLYRVSAQQQVEPDTYLGRPAKSESDGASPTTKVPGSRGSSTTPSFGSPPRRLPGPDDTNSQRRNRSDPTTSVD